MGAIVDYRAAVVAKLRAGLPGVDVQEHHRSGLSAKDIDRCLTNRSVALRVAFAGTADKVALSANELDTPSAWSIYIITKDALPMRRDVLALNLLPTVLRIVCEDHFGTGLTSRYPDRVRAMPVYEGEPEESAASAMIWAVSWVQVVSIPAPADADIHPLLHVITHYDLAPKNGVDEASDTIPMTTS